jgi:hypothetical protein
VRQKHLNVMEMLYNRRQVVADKLDAKLRSSCTMPSSCRPQLGLVPMPPSSSKRTSTHKRRSRLNGSRLWHSRS